MRGLLGFLLLGPGLLWADPPVSLDEVYCATCHFDQGEEFAQSIHYQEGQLLCNDCHGGLPFEAIVKGKIVGAHRLKPGNGPIPH